jgi:hypothetical protein
MRWLFIFLLGCSTEGIPPGGNVDLAGADFSKSDLAQPPIDLAGIDLAGGPPSMCVSTCNRCAGGGCCGAVCCNDGEWCDASLHCRCGMNAGCTAGLMCASGGPISPNFSCGSICCGDAMHPCPL